MSELEQDLNPFEGMGSEVIEALNKFDEERNGLYDWLSSITVEPSDAEEYNDAIAELVMTTTDAFADLGLAIHREGNDIDTEKAEIARLWQQDDNERVKLFQKLVDCECFDSLDEDRTSTVVDDIYQEADDEEGLRDIIHTMYQAYLAGDIEEFVRHLQEKYVQQNPADESQAHAMNFEIIMPDAGLRKHAIDVAKIALGVTVALFIHKKLQK